jgi:hypothetical protein
LPGTEPWNSGFQTLDAAQVLKHNILADQLASLNKILAQKEQVRAGSQDCGTAVAGLLVAKCSRESLPVSLSPGSTNILP